MRTTTAWVLAGAACSVLTGGAGGSAVAQNTVILRENPTDCEVAAALGVNRPGCPPLGQMPAPVRPTATRGLAIGTTDQMPEPPPLPPAAPPLPVASTPAPVAPKPAPVVEASPPAFSAWGRQRPVAAPAYKASFEITFEFGSARLMDGSDLVLNQIGAAMTAPDASDVRFRIVGHTDAVGSAAKNQRLSEARADAVKGYLIQRFGIEAARLEASGRGAHDLLNPNDPTAASDFP